ncbi:choice-of-anchor L domain-containing protein [Epilithonimonas zeae]|uniref:choice-of-anchor L domain-containing protein n=1 Tax=Epilithonimonas zeae TaxID=1416779 RepID=UPI00200C2FC3|nr:choice-of-anchor L domain-containing protein [Epilithonimonas zeae]UQB67308.1 choice-of-anchor L domain-containing protein [Epilithonimonas zeae]
MKRLDCSYYLVFIAILSFGSNLIQAQFINVDVTTYTPQQLVEEFLDAKVSTCISVSNVTVKGGNITSGGASYGYFDKGTSNFDIDKGIILSTGNVLKAPGPNDALQSEIGSGWGGDTDLYDLLGVLNTNATYLEFDFISSISDKVSFEYMFLSEEYDKFKSVTGCGYSDIFAFLIKPVGSAGPYTNIALVPGTNQPVSVVNIRGGGGNCPSKNEDYFGSFNPQTSTSLSPTNFNGQTKILTATADVEIGKKYHIKLVIGDESNPTHDSAVFLKAGSFVGIKDLGSDLSLETGTALCATGTHEIDATPSPVQGVATNYKWYRNGVLVANGMIPKFLVDNTNYGYYEVEIDLDTNCKLKGHINIEPQILPIIGATNFNNICDEDLDGNADVILNTYTSQVVSNLSQDYGFDIKYFEYPPANINNPTEAAITNVKFNSASKDVYMWLKPGSCNPTLTKITLTKNALSSFDNSVSLKPFDICDEKLEGEKEVDISSPDFINSLIPTGFDGRLDFYKSRIGANNKDSKEYLSNTTITLDDKNKTPSFFVRFHQLGFCDNVAEIKFNFKQPKKSTAIQDTVICKNSLINLDADPSMSMGFSSYKWYKASDPSIMISDQRKSGNLSAGDYIVELGFNDCVYKQSVKISEPQDLIINNVLIEDNKITIQASNGIPSYQYFLDGNKQSSNVIENVSKGQHTVEVKDKCGSVLQTFYIINEKNVITPNDDGYNDVIDYSGLMTKIEPRLEVYDRNGVLVFKGSSENQYKWDGKFRGRSLPTASYWYILQWNESGNPNRVQKTGWILLKNRNSD